MDKLLIPEILFTATYGESVTYLYDAAGNKLKQTYNMAGTSGVKTTEFVSNFVYKNNLLAWVNTPECRIVINTDGTMRQEFNIKDHLGNVRVVYSRVSNANVTQQVDTYYPFGMNIKGLTATKTGSTRPNEYLYNGKMSQDEMGLNWLDYGFRMYDPVLGRWNVIDPLAPKFQNISPYAYTFNNPIKYFDSDGRIPWPISKTGSGIGWNTKFGWFGEQRSNHVHQGVDINKNTGGDTDFGLPVYATHVGKVVGLELYNTNTNGKGKVITIQSPDGSFQSVYMHLSAVDVALGDDISEGQKIGAIGKSGKGLFKYYAAHLHYELRKLNSEGNYVSVNPESKRGELIDPQKWISPEENLGEAKPGLNVYTGDTYLSATPEEGFLRRAYNAVKHLFDTSNREQEADFWQRYENEKQNRNPQ